MRVFVAVVQVRFLAGDIFKLNTDMIVIPIIGEDGRSFSGESYWRIPGCTIGIKLLDFRNSGKLLTDSLQPDFEHRGNPRNFGICPST